MITVITGSRKGIGRGLAEHYLTQGHTVIGCSRSTSDLTHPLYQHFELDIADEKSVISMIRTIRKEFGQVDNLINNAGIASMNSALLTPGATITRILETNVIGTFLLCRECAKLMKQKGSGRIVNFATVATPLQLEGEAIYASSKAAVVTLTQILAKEFAPLGITVNAVGPTPVDTDLIKSVPQPKIDALLSRQAICRKGILSDITNVVDFFINPASDFVTGQTLYLGGIS